MQIKCPVQLAKYQLAKKTLDAEGKPHTSKNLLDKGAPIDVILSPEVLMKKELSKLLETSYWLYRWELATSTCVTKCFPNYKTLYMAFAEDKGQNLWFDFNEKLRQYRENKSIEPKIVAQAGYDFLLEVRTLKIDIDQKIKPVIDKKYQDIEWLTFNPKENTGLAPFYGEFNQEALKETGLQKTYQRLWTMDDFTALMVDFCRIEVTSVNVPKEDMEEFYASEMSSISKKMIKAYEKMWELWFCNVPTILGQPVEECPIPEIFENYFD